MLQPGDLLAPLTETRALQNHAWVSTAEQPDFAASDNITLRRFDFAIRRDGFLAVTGVNNGISRRPLTDGFGL